MNGRTDRRHSATGSQQLTQLNALKADQCTQTDIRVVLGPCGYQILLQRLDAPATGGDIRTVRNQIQTGGRRQLQIDRGQGLDRRVLDLQFHTT